MATYTENYHLTKPGADDPADIENINANMDALDAALHGHVSATNNPHGVTKAQVGLGNVPNVATNDQTPTYSEATTLENLTSGEILSVAFGKIKKAVATIISHIGNTNNPHGVTCSQIGAAASGHTHDDRYYTESETDSLLAGKSNTGHTHDSRYYTETEVDTALSGKSNTGHTHAYTDITGAPTIPTVPEISTSIVTDKASNGMTVSPKAVYEYAANDSDFAYINGDSFYLYASFEDFEPGIIGRVSFSQDAIYFLPVTDKSMCGINRLSVSSAQSSICKMDGTQIYSNAGEGVSGWTVTATKYSVNKILLTFKKTSGTINAAAGEMVVLDYPDISIRMYTS